MIKKPERNDLQRRLRNTLKHFDTILKPLKEVIRTHSTNILDHISQGPTRNKELIQECFMNIENYCYQLMIFTIQYIFTDDHYRFNLQGQKTHKMLLIMSMERLKLLFSENQNNEAKRLVNRMDVVMQENASDDEGEGFFNEEEEKPQDNKSQSVFLKNDKYSELMRDPEFQSEKVLKILQEKDEIIRTIQLKLANREKTINEITAGYLKDLQNMRQQMFRQSDDIDFFEVQYFEASDIEDPKYLALVNNKISDLKSQYEKKTRDCMIHIENQKCEISNLKYQIQGLVKKTQNLDNPEYLIVQAFNLEKNAYKLWRFIQDTKGNEFFFEVFEKQKAQYGINYREVNKLLMQTKSYEREFQFYISGIEEQMATYLDRASQCLQEVTEIKNKEIELLKEQLNSQQTQQNTQQINAKASSLNQNRETPPIQIESIIPSQILSKYKDIFLFFQNVLEQLKTTYLQVQNSSITEQEFSDNNEQLKRFIIQTELIRLENEQMKHKIIFFQNQASDATKILESEKQNSKDQLAKLNSIEKNIFLILKLLDPKIQQVQMDGIKLNLEDSKQESTKKFLEKIKLLNSSGRRYIMEISQQNNLNQLGLAALSKSTQSQSTLTNIFDVRIELDQIQKLKDQNMQDSQQAQIFSKNTILPSNIDKIIQNQELFTGEKYCQTYLRYKDIEEMQQMNSDYEEQVASLQKVNSFDNQKNNSNQATKLNQNSNTSQITEINQNSSEYKKNISTQNITIKKKDGNSNDSVSNISKTQQQIIIKPNKTPVQRHQIEFEKIPNLQLKAIQSIVDSKEQDQQTDLKSDNFYTDHEQLQPQEIKLYSQSSDKEIQMRQRLGRGKGVFTRLFDDSKLKQARIDLLKERLEVLEAEKWTEMLQTVNHFNLQEGISEFEEQILQRKKLYSDQLQVYQKISERCSRQIRLETQANSWERQQKETAQKGVAPLKRIPGINIFSNRFKEFQLPVHQLQQQLGISEYFQQLHQENYIQSQRYYIKGMIDYSKKQNPRKISIDKIQNIGTNSFQHNINQIRVRSNNHSLQMEQITKE